MQSSGKTYRSIRRWTNCRGAFFFLRHPQKALVKKQYCIYVCWCKPPKHCFLTETRQTSPRDASVQHPIVAWCFSDLHYWLKSQIKAISYIPSSKILSLTLVLLFRNLSLVSVLGVQWRAAPAARSVSQFVCSSSFETFVFICSFLGEFILRRCRSSPSTCWLTL